MNEKEIAYHKQYRKEHKKEIKERRKKHYAQNKEHILAQSKKYYELNKEKVKACTWKYQKRHKKQHNAYQRKYREPSRKILSNLKINGCAICGYNKYDVALEFHHVEPKDKVFHINIPGIHYHSNEEIVEEISKCILLCANCHRELRKYQVIEVKR